MQSVCFSSIHKDKIPNTPWLYKMTAPEQDRTKILLSLLEWGVILFQPSTIKTDRTGLSAQENW